MKNKNNKIPCFTCKYEQDYLKCKVCFYDLDEQEKNTIFNYNELTWDQEDTLEYRKENY